MIESINEVITCMIDFKVFHLPFFQNTVFKVEIQRTILIVNQSFVTYYFNLLILYVESS